MRKAIVWVLCISCILCTVRSSSTADYPDDELLAGVLRSRSAAFETAAKSPRDPWDVFRAAIDAAVWADMAVTVGNESGLVFMYLKGSYTMETEMVTASVAKWPSGVTIMALLASRTTRLTLDTRANEILGYWTRDENDPRSRVTLRHALGFTTGFESSSCSAGATLQQCTEEYYHRATHSSEPGARKNYVAGGVHLAIAGAMAEIVTGRRFVDLFDQYVARPVGMPNTRYTDPINPRLAGGMVSTSADITNFMMSYFAGRVISEADRVEMEVDQYPQALRDPFSLIVGHYGLTNWYECVMGGLFDNGLSEECRRRHEHGSSGAFGWWPGHNALHKYWWQWMIYDSMVTSGIYRNQWVPLITAIVTGADLTDPNVMGPEPTLADIAKWRQLQPLIDAGVFE